MLYFMETDSLKIEVETHADMEFLFQTLRRYIHQRGIDRLSLAEEGSSPQAVLRVGTQLDNVRHGFCFRTSIQL